MVDGVMLRKNSDRIKHDRVTEAHQTVERNPSMKPYVHETNPVERQAAHTWM